MTAAWVCTDCKYVEDLGKINLEDITETEAECPRCKGEMWLAVQ